MTRFRAVALAWVAIIAAFAGRALAADKPEECTLRRVAELDANVQRGKLLIKIQIEGRDSWLMVDTGSPFNMISRQLVDELKLPMRQARDGAAIDAAGKSAHHFVTIHHMMLGAMRAPDNLAFLVMGEDNASWPGVDGIFSANFLAAYDVELDLAHGKLNLFMQDHCPGHVVYWTQDFTTVPFTMDASLHATFTATVEGHSVRALLDTGAGPTILSAQAARRLLDFDPAAAGTPPDGNVFSGGGTALPFWRHQCASLDIGGVEFRNTELEIVTDKMTRVMREHAPIQQDLMDSTLETPLIIGLHHLERLRVYIAYGERVLYISAANAH